MSNAKLSLLMISPPLFHPHCTQDLPKKLCVCVLFGRGGCSYVPQLIGEVNNLILQIFTLYVDSASASTISVQISQPHYTQL